MNQRDLADASSSTTSKPKKQRGIWWVMKWSSILFLLLIILIVLLNVRLGPGKNSPLVRVSPQTTFATSPLKPNGDVDYLAYINQLHYVPPDQNAMVDLIRIMGPEPEGYMLSPEFFRLMGIAPLPKGGDYIENIDVKLYPKTGKENITATIDGVTLNNEQIEGIALSVPYATGQIPIVDEWFKSNEHHLAALRTAVQKPDYYAPYVGDTMVSVLLPHVQRMRGFARSLHASAMRHLGDGDVAGAIDDQLAMLRLGRHVGSQGFLVELLVGTATEGMGHASIAQTIYSGKCSAEDLRRMASELDALPPLPVFGKNHIDAERTMGLDCVIHIGRNGPLPWSGDYYNGGPQDRPGFPDGLIRSTINWEVVCIEMNKYYDRILSTLEPADIMVRAEMMRAFEDELRAMESQMRTPSKVVTSILSGRSSRGELLAGQMAGMLLPAVQQVFAAGQRVTAKNATTRIAIALELYRLEHGEYPKELSQLVSEFLTALPLDPFSGQLPVYHPAQGAPYQLYSLGPNGKDDGGADMEDVRYTESDLAAVPKIRTIEQMLKKFEAENN